MIEITCTQCDILPGPKLRRGEIEILNSRQIYLSFLTDDGKVKEKVLLNKE